MESVKSINLHYNKIDFMKGVNVSNLIATCLFKYKRTCGVAQCSLKKCCGCIWSRISKKRVSKLEIKKLKDMAEMFHKCESKKKYKPKFSTQYHLKPLTEEAKGESTRSEKAELKT